ncbi:MAG: bifunctional folylpolyglutamate synthase/dihydrofolate synthase [Fimbriimonadaceae bacterium]
MTKQTALEFISRFRTNKNRGSLDRMYELISRAGLSEALGAGEVPRYFHITGTNGKGSVAAYVESLLRVAGSRTGAYYSPYVFQVNERIQVDGSPISDELFIRLVEGLYPVAEEMSETPFGAPNEFEFKTLMAFAAWQVCGCTDVALEVGIGGRLDSTNVVQPVSCAIVSVGLDHMALLGPTLAHIAREKAGIIKPGVPLVAGSLPKAAMEVVQSVAAENDAMLWQVGKELKLEQATSGWSITTPSAEYSGNETGIKGVYQPTNAAVAIGMVEAAGVELENGMVQEAIRQTRLPGRFQIVDIDGKTVVLDGAHNEPAARALRLSLNEMFPGREVLAVVAMLKGHEPARFFKGLGAPLQKVFTTEVDFERSETASNLAAAASRVCGEVTTEPCAKAAFARALNQLADDQVLVLTGSFYLLGDLQEALSPWLYGEGSTTGTASSSAAGFSACGSGYSAEG